MGRVTTKLLEGKDYVTLEYLVDNKGINVKIVKRRSDITARLRIDDVYLLLPSFNIANDIAIAVATLISKEKH